MKQRADGRWVKKIVIDNTPKYFYSTAPTAKKAEEDIARQLLNYHHARRENKTTFLKIAERMIEKKETSTSFNTVQNYKNQLKHLTPLFEYNIEDITLIQLQNLINDLHSKSLGYWTQQKTKTVLGLIYKEAILTGCNVTNLVEFIKLPTMQRSMVHSPDDNTISIIKQNTQIEFGMWAMIILCTGMRRGELAAIQKRDIDFVGRNISIFKSVEYIHNQPRLKTPKTQCSIRTVPIIDILFQPLVDYCASLKPNDYLFGGEKPFSLTMLRKRWDNYLKELGLLITQHQLRHAHSFLLYRAGVDVKTAQYLLGHSDYTTTMNIYTDFDKLKVSSSALQLNSTLCNIG